MEWIILVIPFITALLFWITNKKGIAHTINALSSLLLLLSSVYITYQVSTKGVVTYSFLNGFFYVDALSVIVLDIILVISFMVCIYSIKYLDVEYNHGVMDIKKVKLFYCLTYTFIFTMVLVVTTQNLGLMWIAIEATTLASAFLVGFYNNKHSIEAAWKYIIICSVGIAFALLGIVFLYFSSVNMFHDTKVPLNWQFLFDNAGKLQGSVLKISFLFILVGFGTKVGFAPMHTWLPDAHSQAPSPISALLSGVLLNSALYGIIRVLTIVNKNLGSSVFTGRLLIAIGIISIATAAVFIVSQKDYKRLLAYSSIEHMGILAFALGVFTPLSIFAALFHMMNHSFTKSMLFLTSGNVFLKFKTKEISKVTNLLKKMPVTGLAFLLGLFAIAGAPPFSVFFSEFGIILSTFKEDHFVLGAIFTLLITLVFAGIAISTLRMFAGNADHSDIPSGEINIPGLFVICTLFIIILISGIYMPQDIKNLLDSATTIIRGGQ